MALIGYNRRMLWVIIPVIVWSMIGMAWAVGLAERNIRFGPPEGSIVIRGMLLKLTESEGKLVVTIGIPPALIDRVKEQVTGQLGDLHENLEIEYEKIDPQAPPGKPGIMLDEPSRREPRRPRDRHTIITREYIVRYKPHEVRIIPKREWIRNMRDRRGNNDLIPPDRPATERDRPLDRLRDRMDGPDGPRLDEQPVPPGDGPPPEGPPPEDWLVPPPEGDSPPEHPDDPPSDDRRRPPGDRRPPVRQQPPPDENRPQPPDGQQQPPRGNNPPGSPG